MLFTYEATAPTSKTTYHFGPFLKGRGHSFEKRLEDSGWTNIKLHQLNPEDMALGMAELSYNDQEGYDEE